MFEFLSVWLNAADGLPEFVMAELVPAIQVFPLEWN
jgi:hypothetical protein